MSPTKSIEFIPTSFRQQPPIKQVAEEDGRPAYLWYITEDEYLRLNKLFRRDFQETGMGGTIVVGEPVPCRGCGKYSEFIDWAWTALQREVHSREFMFKALVESRQGMEVKHDVYCSECGLLTTSRSNDNSEGGAADIYQAGALDRSTYTSSHGAQGEQERPKRLQKSSESKPVTWGKWWLDNSGKCLVAAYGDKVVESPVN
ncbi:hypothetical protein GYMLUDRAFT_244855 [Collybiopsis luxurians FD-317 M1]|uniref:Unplaced genomic scaffold GYMLUscaffold_29, whole genome shotgun sequence n=1 Tax=Collybiopsis luxurians FD-317 M1 TaxID=944289 RepID=A0A0D0BWT7_9AGAR|nr:hypothetical protein GYMLUDRAFT_244855 [Collybiopsis luxurians FD-317 M1]